MKKNTTPAVAEPAANERAQLDPNYAPPMDVSVRINSMQPEGATRARLSLNLGGVFAVRGVKLMDGRNGPFLSMPSYKVGESYKDVCFSFDEKFTQYMTDRVVQDYEQALEQTRLSSQNRSSQPGQSPMEAPSQDAGQQMAGM